MALITPRRYYVNCVLTRHTRGRYQKRRFLGENLRREARKGAWNEMGSLRAEALQAGDFVAGLQGLSPKIPVRMMDWDVVVWGTGSKDGRKVTAGGVPGP